MDNMQDRVQTLAATVNDLPWHRPVLQRLEISTETRFGGGSIDDGDGFGLVEPDGFG